MPRESARQTLIDAGLDTVHRDGFTASGVAAITGAAQVPKGSFYNHFVSKDEFGRVLIDHYWDQTQDELTDVLGADDRPAPERLQAYFELLRDQAQPVDFARGCLIGNLAAEAGALSEVLRIRLSSALAAWVDALADVIAAGQRAGSITSPARPDELAAALLDSWQGALIRAKVRRDSEPLDLFLRLLLPTLLAAPDPG